MKTGNPGKYLLFLLCLALVPACRSLDNEAKQEWAKLNVTITANQGDSSQRSISTSSFQTAAISVVPASLAAPSLEAYEIAYDTQLQNLSDNTVTLSVPLNESIKLLKGAYSETKTLDEILSDPPVPNAYGLSEAFTVTGADEQKTITIALTSDFSWQFIDGDGAEGLNKVSTVTALKPHLLGFNSKLYLTWNEKSSAGHHQIRVREWDGTTWRFVDGGGEFGINKDTGANAESPRLIELGSELYIAFDNTNSPDDRQIRLAKWDGDSTWSFQDGNLATGLNATPTESAYGPYPVIYNSSLYLSWYEVVPGGETQIRLCLISGSSCSMKDSGSLNIDSARSARVPVLAVHGSTLFEIWEEYREASGDQGSIHVKSYNGTTHTLVDGGGTGGINYSASGDAEEPAAVMFLDDLYVAWNEDNKVRIRKFNGSTWTWVDGGDADGMNKDAANQGGWIDMIVYNNRLYAGWHEVNSSGKAQIRVYRTGNGTTWEPVDGAGENGLNKDPLNNAILVNFAVFNAKLYLAFTEDTTQATDFSSAVYNIRVLEAGFE